MRKLVLKEDLPLEFVEINESEVTSISGGGFFRRLGIAVGSAIATTLMHIEDNHDRYLYGHPGGARP